MPTPAGLPVRRQRFLVVALALYAATTLISMAVMSIGAAIAAAAIVWVQGGPRGVWREIRALISHSQDLNRYWRASLILIGTCALSTLVAALAPVGWGGHFVHPGVEDLGKYWYFAWPLVLFLGLRSLDERGRAIILKAWFFTLAAVSLIGVAQYFTGWPRPQPIPSSPAHFHATMFLGHHLSVASILIFPFFVSLDLFRRLLPAWFMAAVSFLAFAALFFTYSRMLWIALPLGLVIWAARALSRKQLAAVLVAATIGLLALFQAPPVRERIANGMGIGERQKLWLANIEFLKLRPLTGTGFRRNNEASSHYLQSLPNDGYVFTGHAHNNLLDMLGGTGLLGALAWLAWCWVIFSLLLRGLRNREQGQAHPFMWALLCAWIVFHLNGLTQVNFWEGKVMHQMMWVIAWSFLWLPNSSRSTSDSIDSNSEGLNVRNAVIRPDSVQLSSIECPLSGHSTSLSFSEERA